MWPKFALLINSNPCHAIPSQGNMTLLALIGVALLCLVICLAGTIATETTSSHIRENGSTSTANRLQTRLPGRSMPEVSTVRRRTWLGPRCTSPSQLWTNFRFRKYLFRGCSLTSSLSRVRSLWIGPLSLVFFVRTLLHVLAIDHLQQLPIFAL